MFTYNPLNVILTVGGYQVSGYASGTFIEATREKEDYTDEAGSDGEVCRVNQTDKRGTIKVTLMQHVASNDVLMSLLLSGSVVSVQLEELNGTTVIGGPEAWVQKPADAPYADTLSNREWIIRVGKLKQKIGGLTS